MKRTTQFIGLLLFCLSASAQSETTTVNYLKAERDAVSNEIPFPEKTIMQAVDNKMGQMGYKGKDTKGFMVYKAVKSADFGSGEYDLYFIAERKSRRNKNNSTLTLMISKGGENFATVKTDKELLNNAKRFLDNISPVITAFDLELQINDQQETLNKTDKKYNNLVDEGQSLEKKRKNIEKDIDDNKKDQEKQLADLEKQKQILETLKAGRKQ
jgi:hypothetical protein